MDREQLDILKEEQARRTEQDQTDQETKQPAPEDPHDQTGQEPEPDRQSQARNKAASR